jgi:hypothetical protein
MGADAQPVISAAAARQDKVRMAHSFDGLSVPVAIGNLEYF